MPFPVRFFNDISIDWCMQINFQWILKLKSYELGAACTFQEMFRKAHSTEGTEDISYLVDFSLWLSVNAIYITSITSRLHLAWKKKN